MMFGRVFPPFTHEGCITKKKTMRHPIPSDAISSEQFLLMSSWIALIWHPGMKSVFKKNYMKSKYVLIFIMMILVFS